MDDAAMADRLTLGQNMEHRKRIALPVCAYRKSQVGLIAVAERDVLAQPGKSRGIMLAGP